MFDAWGIESMRPRREILATVGKAQYVRYFPESFPIAARRFGFGFLYVFRRGGRPDGTRDLHAVSKIG